MSFDQADFVRRRLEILRKIAADATDRRQNLAQQYIAVAEESGIEWNDIFAVNVIFTAEERQVLWENFRFDNSLYEDEES
jgi:hypothetical protein